VSGAPVIPIDGKTLKGTYDRNHQQPALHVVSAWASENRLLLGQVAEVTAWFEQAEHSNFVGLEHSYSGIQTCENTETLTE
jgi:hypothetical protein